ncbi:MAG TPA: hypothetical protein VM821_00255 [Abditibacteriaceae bacterium]|nr:hypothetical protein [Abditibacteriaceae bacterium]
MVKTCFSGDAAMSEQAAAGICEIGTSDFVFIGPHLVSGKEPFSSSKPLGSWARMQRRGSRESSTRWQAKHRERTK